MKLYQSIGPNPRVALMYVAEKGIAIDRAFVDIMAGENRQSPYIDLNPQGGTPLLTLDDGSSLAESTVICEYLEELHPAPPLIGTTPAERAETRALLRRIDHDVLVPMVVGFRGAEGLGLFKDRMLCVPDASDGTKALAREGMTGFERTVQGREWLAGDRFTLADIVLFCFVEFGAQIGQPMPDELKLLKAWQARVAARPSAAASADPKHGL